MHMMQFRSLHTQQCFTAALQLHRNIQEPEDHQSFIWFLCALTTLISFQHSFPSIPHSCSKCPLAFFLPSPSSISNRAAIYHSAVNKVAVISLLFYVVYMFEIFHLLAESLRNVSSVRIHFTHCFLKKLQDRYNHSQIFCRVLWANVSH